MGDLEVRPRCSAEVEEGRCHFMKEVPVTRGTLLRSIIFSLVSGRSLLQMEGKRTLRVRSNFGY